MNNSIKMYEMNNQIEQITNNFGLYLRRQKTKDTLYITVCHLGQVYKIATGVNVACGQIRPRRWDSRDAEVNKKLLSIRLLLSDLLCNFASADILTIKNEIRNKLNIETMNNCPKSRTPRASKVLTETFEKLYSPSKSTYKTYKTHVNRFIEFLEYIRETDKINGGDSLDKLKLEWIVDFRNWLTDNGLSPKTIKITVNFIVSLINNIAEDRKYIRYVSKIEKISNVKEKTTEKKEKYLNVEQINTFMKYSPVGKTEMKTYDIFKLMLLTGLRISDIQQILNGQYVQGVNNTLVVKTKKTKETANVIVTNEIKQLIEKYDGYTIPSTFNDNLKALFKNILPNDVTEYDQQKGRTVEHVTTEIYNIISAHWARHSFITYCVVKGMSKDQIKQMVGHADEKMINEVYGHLTAEDENKLFAEKYTENPLKNKVTVIDKSKEYLKENMDSLIEATAKGYGKEYIEVMEEMDNINGDTLN